MNIQEKLKKIFSKDSRTLKSIERNIKKGTSDKQLIVLAYRARKANKKLNDLITELNYNINDLLLEYPTKKRGTKKVDENKEIEESVKEIKETSEKIEKQAEENISNAIKEIEEEESKQVADKDEQYPGIEQLTEEDKHPKISKIIDEVDENIIVKKDTSYKENEDEEETGFLNKTISLIKNTLFGKSKKKDNLDNSNINYTISGNSQISLFINGDIKTITSEHQQFDEIKNALEREDFAKARELIDIKKKVEMFVGDNFKIIEDSLYYQDEKLEGVLADKIIDLVLDEKVENKTIYPFLKFLMKVKKNPDQEAVKDLYLFLQKGKIPITRSGNIITYKKITKDWKDCYTRQIDNSIGSIVKLDRNQCDNNRNVTCSAGLHVASYSYMKEYCGDRIVLCEVNPKNVVSVPVDYNSAKMRCCEYKVIKEVTDEGEVLKNTIIF